MQDGTDRSQYIDGSDDEKEGVGPMLNYDQYYPTMLPMREPGMEEGFRAEDLQAGAHVAEFTHEQVRPRGHSMQSMVNNSVIIF